MASLLPDADDVDDDAVGGLLAGGGGGVGGGRGSVPVPVPVYMATPLAPSSRPSDEMDVCASLARAGVWPSARAVAEEVCVLCRASAASIESVFGRRLRASLASIESVFGID